MALFDFLQKKDGDKNSPAIAPVLPSDIYAQGTLDLADTIAPAALKVGSKQLEIGEKFSRSFYTISYPRFLADSWFMPIINLDKIFDVGIFIHPIDTAQALRGFQRKVAEVQSQISEREEKGLVRDPMLDTAYQDIENLRDQLQQAQEHLYDVGLYITLYGSSEAELDKIEGDVRGILDSKLIYTKPALFQQEQGFRSTLPLANDELGVNSKLTSSPLSSIFPFVSFDLTSDRGILYGINRHNSSLILFDRFSLENYNSVTFAKSGSGKSVRGNESVLIRENGKARLAKIGPVIEKLIRERGLEQIDDELEGVTEPGIEVFSFNKNQQGRWSPVSVAARKSAPDVYYTFTTASGRSITTTADHNMLVLRDGLVVAAKSDAVKEGESVPLPRQVSAFSDTPTSLNLLKLFATKKNMYVVGASDLIQKNRKAISAAPIDPVLDRYVYKYAAGRRIPLGYFHVVLKRLSLEASDELTSTFSITSANGSGVLPALMPASQALGRILGYISSEGTVTNGSIIISNIDLEITEDIKNAFDELGVSHFTIDRAIATSHRPFLALVDALGTGGNSKTKQVPGDLFGMSRETAAAYLQAYFEGDGGVDGVSVTALSKSRELISGLSYLLLSFGIITRVHKRTKRYAATGGRRTFWHLTISGQSNLQKFSEQIGFISKRKQQLLADILSKNENTNVDVVPGLKGLADELTELFGSQLQLLPDLSCLRQGKDLSPQRLGRLVAEIENRMQHFRDLAPFMLKLSELPTIEVIVEKAQEDRELSKNIAESLGSSWYTVARGMQPRINNALKIFAAAGELGYGAPESSKELKTMVLEGVHEMNVQQNTVAPHLSVSLRGERDNSSYSMMQHAADFITSEYERTYSVLPRVREIVDTFRRLAESDLFWDPIVSIKTNANTKEKYVYDLTVDDEVFLAGSNGMFVHNSYAVKLEILRSLMFDTDVIVIDPEREYEYLAQATGGRLFNISLSSENHINPFDLPPVKEDEEPADILRSNIINLVGLFRIMLGGLTPEEDAIIDRAISETYALKDITGDADFTGAEPPLLSDFESVLSGMEGSNSLVQRLSKYTHGTWAGFLNQPTNVDINKQFIVFSVRDMEDELKPVAMYIVTHFIWNSIRHELKKRLLIIDEAWWMMKSEDTASFLYSLAKRGRKYYLGVSTITQDVEDFLRSPYGKPILTNSSLQLLLKQSPTTVDVLQQTFNLTEEEKYLLLESGVGEGLFFAGLKHVAIKIVASYTEDQIITSDPSQLLAIKAEKERHSAAEGEQV